MPVTPVTAVAASQPDPEEPAQAVYEYDGEVYDGVSNATEADAKNAAAAEDLAFQARIDEAESPEPGFKPVEEPDHAAELVRLHAIIANAPSPKERRASEQFLDGARAAKAYADAAAEAEAEAVHTFDADAYPADDFYDYDDYDDAENAAVQAAEDAEEQAYTDAAVEAETVRQAEVNAAAVPVPKPPVDL